MRSVKRFLFPVPSLAVRRPRLDAGFLILLSTEDSVSDMTPFDLHVLGTPPAFVLSQDQTL